jgi:hypothetical protein
MDQIIGLVLTVVAVGCVVMLAVVAILAAYNYVLDKYES